jgi:hypothetical protein
MFGLDPIKTINSIKGIPYYFRNLILLKKQQKASMQKIPFGLPYPCLNDRFSDSGEAKGHYFHQDLLIASRVYQNNPKLHIDIGSRVDGFVAHVASFRKVKVLDIRPLSNKILNVEFVQADLMSSLISELHECCDSLSCLHAIEHFGLGRYGDRVDYDGYLHGLENLYKILKKNGKLYLSVPIGPQRIEFDAHRIFSINYLLKLFEKKYQIDCFSYVDDDGALHSNVAMIDVNNNFGCRYGCGIFEMTKI